MTEVIDKTKIFEKELSYIKNERYLENIKIIIELLPDYFFEIPASSTGKYHPSFSLGEGGLVRHTKAAIRIAYELLQNNSVHNFKSDEEDLIIIGLLLHDSFKSGFPKEEYTRVDHPLLVCNFLRNNKDKYNFTDEEIKYLCDIISTHMGEFNKDYKGNVVLPLPRTREQRFVHMCDYLSSKKFLDIKFINNNIQD